MNCTNCGASLAEGAAFCPACGTRVEAQSAAPASSAPPQYPPQQYPPQYQQQYRPPREGFLTIAVKPLEMILKIGAMVIALYSLIYFIVGLIPVSYAYGVAIGGSFVNAFFGLLEGAGIAAVMFALGQLAVTIDKKK